MDVLSSFCGDGLGTRVGLELGVEEVGSDMIWQGNCHDRETCANHCPWLIKDFSFF